MAKAQFKKALSTNSKREYRRAVKNEVIGKEAGEYVARSITVIILPGQHSKISSKGKGLDNPNAFLATEWLKSQKTFFQSGGIRKRLSAAEKGGTYTFNWHTDAVFNDTRGTDLNYVEEQSRKFINKGIEWAKSKNKKTGLQNVPGYKDPSEEQVGGHIQAQAFLQKLRKATAYGLITQDEANDLQKSYMRGGISSVMASIGAGESVTKDNTKLDKGFINIEENSEIATVLDTLDEDVSEKGQKFGVYREVMIPIPRDMNSAQATQYENAQVKRIGKWLDALADQRLYDQPLSPSLQKMHQEIIVAKLLGKKAPKYKEGYNIRQRSKGGKKSKKFRLPKTKGAASKAGKAKFAAQLRNNQGQFASPTSLIALLNKKLPQEIQNNMRLPSLEYDTGKFANSVRAIKITQKGKTPTLQYTYDTDPYQVFETGGRGDSRWATEGRDPRTLIDKTIREIAREMMVTRFTTQRL